MECSGTETSFLGILILGLSAIWIEAHGVESTRVRLCLSLDCVWRLMPSVIRRTSMTQVAPFGNMRCVFLWDSVEVRICEYSGLQES